jgi:hypothetical protein
MATSAEVLEMLIPTGGWVTSGNDWSGVQFIEAKPITEAQFNAGFAQFDVWKANAEAQKATDKAAVLVKLGINEDEARLLLS